MKKSMITILIACLGTMVIMSPVHAQMATMDEALNVANNWITIIIEKKGDWGGAEAAWVDAIQEFTRGQRTVGYFCYVKPLGFIVISLRKELAPVKAYSATCDLDPDSDEGMTDLIKGGMERILDAIEKRLGPLDSAWSEDLENLIKTKYRGSWEQLESDPTIFEQKLASGDLKTDYQGGEVMLSSSWNQEPPYNNDCRDDGCIWGGCCETLPVPYGCNNNVKVGCTATAGAQIMRYWNWPPYGAKSPCNDPYDWRKMPDRFPGCSWPAAQVDAVAELCYEVGIAVGMTYSCTGSHAPTSDMKEVYVDYYRYSDYCVVRDRNDYPEDGVEWFNGMKEQFNWNRPVQYRVENHSIVGDGWQEVWIEGVFHRQYHMNYGWDNNFNAWYDLDKLFMGGRNEEYRVENIFPAVAVENQVSGTYSLQSFPYRYFDRDATGSSATFQAGQYLQFLPRITVTGTGGTGQTIRFEGSSSANTRFFTRGDISKGVLIEGGAVELTNNGSIKLF